MTAYYNENDPRSNSDACADCAHMHDQDPIKKGTLSYDTPPAPQRRLAANRNRPHVLADGPEPR